MKIILFFFLFLSACSDFTYSRELEGKVLTLGSRFGATSRRTQEKFSVVLQPIGRVDSTIERVAGGPSGIVIECVSTRCAVMQPGSCHQFKCSFEWATGADVIKCKHVKEVRCESQSPVQKIDQGLPGTNGL